MRKPMIVPDGSAALAGESVIPYEPGNQYLSGQAPETDDEAERQGPDANSVFWRKQIAAALTHERRWRNEALAAERTAFGPDQDTGSSDGEKTTLDQINDETSLIRANLEVLKPLVYSETPQPIVRRRWHGDGKNLDETALMAAECAQRLALYMLDTEDFDAAMKGARDDWLTVGRGQVRVVYKPASGRRPERAVPRYVPWARYLIAPSSSRDTAPWEAYEIPMTRTAIERRFPDHAPYFSYNTRGLVDSSRGLGDDERNRGGLDAPQDETGALTPSPFDTAKVWEIWNREEREVIWWSGSCPKILDKIADPLDLVDFTPSPPPLLSNCKSDSSLPRPDMRFYQKRAEEIEIASKKLRSILNVISVSGLFPGQMVDEIKKLLDGSNRMIAVKDWLALMEKGGTNNIVQWLPLDAIAAAANALVLLRQQSKDAMFEASGISDIMRAQGDPNETATAQQIKGRYAGLRLSDRQRTMAHFALATLRIMLEIGVEQFSTQTLAEITGLDLPMTEVERAAMIARQEQQREIFAAQVQLYQTAAAAAQAGEPINPGQPPVEPKFEKIPETSWELVHARLRNDITRSITISIETNSTILADEQADKEARTEFLAAFATFVNQLMPLTATGQFDLKTIKELLLFGIRGFPKSRTLESMIAALPDEPQGPPQKDVQVQVAEIKGGIDKMLKEMDGAEREKDRAHELRLKGVDLIADAAEMAAPKPQNQNPPQPPRPDKQPQPRR